MWQPCAGENGLSPPTGVAGVAAGAVAAPPLTVSMPGRGAPPHPCAGSPSRSCLPAAPTCGSCTSATCTSRRASGASASGARAGRPPARPGGRHRRQHGSTPTPCRPSWESYGELLAAPGVFVFGSKRLLLLRPAAQPAEEPAARRRHLAHRRPGAALARAADAFTGAGWADLDQHPDHDRGARRAVAFAGVDDPTSPTTGSTRSAGPADPDADPRWGSPAPYLRVLDQLAADGYDAVLAGHTHGGQVYLPASVP